MFHKVIVVGHLGRDPEMRYLPDGTPVTTFSVATTRRRRNPDGTTAEETVWFRVSAFRKLAENCNSFLQKGRLVLVEGQLRPDPATGGPRTWTGNDGTVRASYELNALDVRFLGARGEAAPVEAPIGEAEAPLEDEEASIPF
jgi:single-strand DNA-binding protein